MENAREALEIGGLVDASMTGAGHGVASLGISVEIAEQDDMEVIVTGRSGDGVAAGGVFSVGDENADAILMPPA